MENNLENKAKFFAQYWDQKVLTKVIRGEYRAKVATRNTICSNWKIGELVESYLELKPLSSITDEDAKKLDFRDSDHFKFDASPANWKDELRLLGYAVEWVNLSIEKQLEYGWIKLKND